VAASPAFMAGAGAVSTVLFCVIVALVAPAFLKREASAGAPPPLAG
jgi:hypothetical protein